MAADPRRRAPTGSPTASPTGTPTGRPTASPTGTPTGPRRRGRTGGRSGDPALVLALGLALVCALLFLFTGLGGGWRFLLAHRGVKLAAMLVIATATATATLLFQTITRNQILTPSIIGFDALYLLILTACVFSLGAAGFGQLPAPVLFAVNLAVMMGASVALFGTLVGRAGGDLMRMVLTGLIFAVLFRSLTQFLQRLIDPNDFITVQAGSFARFDRVEPPLLWLCLGLCGLAIARAWQRRFQLDVLALGRDRAAGLGVPVRRAEREALLLVATLVASATALVGPIAAGLAGPAGFLGLLAVSLARALSRRSDHARLIPLSAAIAAATLIGGQWVMERVLALATPVGAVIDLLGGAVFLILVLRRARP